MRLCEIPGCGRPHKARGYCIGHYMRVKERGDVRPEVPLGAERPCVVEGCGRKHYGRGWCRAHHERWRRTGSVQAEVPITHPRAGTRYWFGQYNRGRSKPAVDLIDTDEL